jgi:protein-L-isoaspartate(D-aspartate) O-methyltransferase
MAEFADREGIGAVYRDQAILTKGDLNRPLSSSSQPRVMARMLEQLELAESMNVLEIGAGTGYNAALLSLLARRVVSVELDPRTATEARAALRRGGYRARVVTADGHGGFAGGAPYDRMIVTASTDAVPRAWWNQLVSDGLLVVPLRLGGWGAQAIAGLEKTHNGFRSRSVIAGGFMPMRTNGSAPPPSSFLGANADGRLIRGLTGASLATLTAEAKRRLLATVLGDARRVPLPFRTRGHALGLFVSLTLPAGRFVMSMPGFAVGAIARDGRSLALLGRSSLAAFGDDRAAELLLRRVDDWDRRGRPRESDLRLSVSFRGNRSTIRRRWPSLA